MFGVLVAELVRNNHFLRERQAGAERKLDLAHAEMALVRAQASPRTGRRPGSRRSPRRPRGKSLTVKLRSELTGGSSRAS